MSFSTRFSNGWTVAKTSMKVLSAHKELIVFPILSGLSLLLVIGSFVIALLAGAGWDASGLQIGNFGGYLVIFLFYIINYFIVVFFNMALMHCARLYFEGDEVSVSAGLLFSASRVRAIFSWAVFAATVGTILKVIQDNVGWLGRLIIGITGIAWSVSTFFVIPVIAYESLGPVDSLKRSAEMMKEKWGEGIGANFSIGLIGLVAFFAVGIIAAAVSSVNEGLGIGVFVLGSVALLIIGSAIRSILISAIYNNIKGNINDHFHQQMLDGLFIVK
jgi:hypothetical protein